MHEIQFWDTNALIPLIFEESGSVSALKAHEAGNFFLAWEWIVIEANAALHRRKASARQFDLLHEFLEHFKLIHLSPDSGNHAELIKILEKHHLRSADAGHLFCLKRAKELYSNIEFVCFDDELIRAAKREGIRVFGKH